MKHPLRIMLTLLVTVSLALGGCTPSAPEPRDEIDVILGQSAVSLNPYSPVVSARQVGELVFRGLTDVRDGQVVPDLLVELPTKANGGISQDGRTITYHLDRNARWHDGEPLTADDVAFTARLMTQGEIQDEPAAEKGVIESVRVASPDTIVLRLRQPMAPLVWRWMPYVLPAHLLSDSPDLLSDPYWSRPVGSGPFKVVSYERRTTLVLRPVDAENPDLRVHFTNDQATARKVWDSAADAVWIDPSVTAATPDESFEETSSSTWRGLFFNFASTSTGDPAVRRAVMAATTLPVPSVVPSVAPSYSPRLPSGASMSTSERDAPKILTAAGWQRGRGQVRSKRGEPLVLLLLVSELVSEEGDTFLNLQNRWGAMGAAADIAVIGAQSMADGFFYGGRLWTGKYELARYDLPVDVVRGWAWPFDPSDMPSAANPYGLNISRVDDRELNDLYSSMRNAGTPEELKASTRSAWSRVEALDVAVWEGPLPSSVLFKGVGGVHVETEATSALLGAVGWNLK